MGKLDIQSFQAICHLGNQRIEKMVEGINFQLPNILNADGTAFYYLDFQKEEFIPWFKDDRQHQKARENISINNPVISELLEKKDHVSIELENCTGKILELLKSFDAQNMAICPAFIGEDVFCLVLAWNEEKTKRIPEEKLGFLKAGLDKFQLLVSEVANSAYLYHQVEEFALIQDALMDLTNASTLNQAMRSFIESLEKLLDDFYGAQIYLYKDEELIFSAGKWDDIWRDEEYSRPSPDGVNNTVARTGVMELIPDVQNSHWLKDSGFTWGGSLIVAPLNAHNRAVGVVNVRLTEIGGIPEDKVRLVNLLANQAALAIDRERDHLQIKNRSNELEVLLHASFELTSTMELDDIKNIVVENAMKLSPEALNAFLFLYDGQGMDFGSVRWRGIQKNVTDFIHRKNGITATVARSGEKVIIKDVTQHELYADGKYVKDGFEGALVGIPLKHGERVVGVLTCAFKTPQNFNTGTINVLQILADQAALAIQNSRLYIKTTAQANTDFLTGLGNRRAFNQRLESEINRAKRYKQKFALLFCDLDEMKMVNDKFGHLIGDKVLQIVAGIFEDNLRESDFVSRWGGDEFVILMPEADRQEALKVGEKLAKNIKTYAFPWHEVDDFKMTISMGVACYPEVDTKQKLIQVADVFLYKGKQVKI